MFTTYVFTYIRERFDGYEARPNQKLVLFQKEVSAFPDYYAQYFKEAMMGAPSCRSFWVVCTEPVKYKGEEKLQMDIFNLKAAARPYLRPRAVAGHRPLPTVIDHGSGVCRCALNPRRRSVACFY